MLSTISVLAVTAVVLLLTVLGIALQVYGIYLGFKKAWYVGAIAIVIPLFALVVGTSKAVFDKDLLAA